jgi:hypothetical protein
LVGYEFVIRIILTILTAVAVFPLMSPAYGQALDLLVGVVDDEPICYLTPDRATAVFGISSRNHQEEDRLVMEFSHHGLTLHFVALDPSQESRLMSVTLYAADRDGFMGYRGHFLDTVASGTRSDPVKRLLRSARAEILSEDTEHLVARLEGFELEIRFVSDVIDQVTLECSAENVTGDGA